MNFIFCLFVISGFLDGKRERQPQKLRLKMPCDRRGIVRRGEKGRQWEHPPGKEKPSLNDSVPSQLVCGSRQWKLFRKLPLELRPDASSGRLKDQRTVPFSPGSADESLAFFHCLPGNHQHRPADKVCADHRARSLCPVSYTHLGKSTLMQVLDGKRRPSGGMVRLGTGARPSIFAQQQNRLGQGRVIDVIWNKYPRMTELEVRSHLAKLGFRGETVFKPCEALSGGELARLRFAEIVLERPNLLFLDEPTNHLDIYTRENLTEALMAYTGTLLMVTHDRHLMNSLGCPILYLEDGKATLYPSYDALMGRAAPAAAPEKAGDQPAKAGYGKEQRRRRAELRAKIKACEDEMEACGAREVELDNEINSPEVYNDPDLLRQKSDELSDLRFHQEELFAAWEKAMEEQEQYEQAAGEE